MARKSLIIRIDPALWEEIDRWAKDELRSINGQIEYILRDAVVKRRRANLPEPESDEPDTKEPPDSGS
ncbi:MAG: Arc family DNA binding domain-containing protein [Candidatus Sumerlaeia bacterium]